MRGTVVFRPGEQTILPLAERQIDHAANLYCQFAVVEIADGQQHEKPRSSNAPTDCVSDVTTFVRPDNQVLAIRAAQAVELDVAGIDFLTTDINRSYSRERARPHRSHLRRRLPSTGAVRFRTTA